MTSPEIDTTDCDREPIHVPGSIQPYGVLLVAEPERLNVVQAAGDVAGLTGQAQWIGRGLDEVLDADFAAMLRESRAQGRGGYVGSWTNPMGDRFDVGAHAAGGEILIEFEPGSAAALPAVALLGDLEEVSRGFERAANLKSLCERAVAAFRRLTGFDRVMIYRARDDEAGIVLAEDRAADMSAFLNHHFPGSDIPRQARALYLRNLTRVIPDVGYAPAPLLPARPDRPPLDMSDCGLRSVSPIHVQYLKNMGVAASASISIVVDDALWGLVACHNETPRSIAYEMRAACRVLAVALARQIKAREDAEIYRDRLRLRTVEEDLVAALSRAEHADDGLVAQRDTLRRMLDADGVLVVRGREVQATGACPPAAETAALVKWMLARSAAQTFATHELSKIYPAGAAFAAQASGALAVTISTDPVLAVLWFRAETIEIVNWAGNPHKAVGLAAGETLTPRASFEAWSETVRGVARRWSLAEIEGAGRLRDAVLALRQTQRMREVNVQLAETIADKDLLLGQKEVLLREVNHRVQNSLFLVSSFLSLQKRDFTDPELRAALDEAERRVRAVGLVHRRLYRGDQIETVDLDRFLGDMREEMILSMGPEWEPHLTIDAAPAMVATDKAVSIGLIVTELVINANKYAYGGGQGPIQISLRVDHTNLRLTVSDSGRGAVEPKGGFGTRMMGSLVRQLGGRIEYHDNDPGLRAVLTAPLA